MFGSDGGCGPASITTAYLRRIARLRAPEEQKQMILGRNALEFLFGKDGAAERMSGASGAASLTGEDGEDAAH